MTDQALKDLVASLAISQAKTDAQMAKTSQEIKNLAISQTKTDQKLQSLIKQFQGYQNNDASIIEHYFQKAFKKVMSFKGITYDAIAFNLEKKHKGKSIELDIVLLNGSKALIVEVKRKPHISDVEQLLNQKQNFTQSFLEYKDYEVNAVLAGSHFYDSIIEVAKTNGISLIQPSNGGMEVVV